MALTNLQRLRLGVGDRGRAFRETFVSDGKATWQQLQNAPIAASATAYHDWTAQTAGIVWDFDAGHLRYTGAVPTAGVEVGIVGQAVTFSDTELNDVLTRQSNDIRGSTIEVIEWLMADAALRFKWATNQGLEVDETKSFKNLLDMHERLLSQQEEDSFEGGNVEWALEQGNF